MLKVAEAEEHPNTRQKALEARMRAMQVEQQKRSTIKKFMTIGAYERLMNVRVANYELYTQLVDLILSLIQTNRITTQLTETQLKDILSRVTYKPESKIEFRHK